MTQDDLDHYTTSSKVSHICCINVTMLHLSNVWLKKRILTVEGVEF